MLVIMVSSPMRSSPPLSPPPHPVGGVFTGAMEGAGIVLASRVCVGI